MRAMRETMGRIWALAVCGAILVSGPLCPTRADGGDWPQFLGPNRDGKTAPGGPEILDDEPGAGFPLVWNHKVGDGFAGPVISDGRVILFHRVGDDAVVEAFGAKDGERLWRTAYRCEYEDDFGFDPGPRSPPTVAGGSVYCYGVEGMVTALDLGSGEIRWQVDTREKFGSPKGFFGRAGAPLIVGELAIVNVGGRTAEGGAGIVAFDVKTGAVRWVATDDEASYSSPIYREIGGRGVGIFFTREGICGVEIEAGKVLFQDAFRPQINASVNAATPVDCGGNRFFFSAAYDLGSAVWEVGEDVASARQIWANADAMDCHYATPIFSDGHLFGYHGRQETGQELRCVAAADGAVRWKETMVPGNLILDGDKLLAMTEKGELVIVRANPERYEELGRGQILRAGSRAYPAMAGGFFYARDTQRLVCVDLRVPPK